MGTIDFLLLAKKFFKGFYSAEYTAKDQGRGLELLLLSSSVQKMGH